MNKLAVDMPTKQQTEQDLSKMALVFLKDRAPQLLPNLIGFEIVDNNEDMTRIVAMFGLEIGDEFYYVPTFFINDQVRGMMSLYSKQDDTFIPLQEKWINYILDKDVMNVGKKAPMDRNRKYDTPDFSRVSQPPMGKGTKMASAWVDICNSVGDSLATDPKLQEAFGGAVKSIEKQTVKSASSDLLGFMNTKGTAFQDKILDQMNDPTFFKAAMAFYDMDEIVSVPFTGVAPIEKKAATIKVITSVYDDEYSSCSDKDRHRMVRDGFTVKDDRKDDEKSEVFPYKPDEQITTPDVPGFYKVVLTSGDISDSQVLMPTFDGADFVVVYDPDTRKAFTADTHRVFCAAESTDTKYDKRDPYRKDAISFSDVLTDKDYVFIGPRGDVTKPFHVDNIIERDRTAVAFNGTFRDDVSYDSNYKSNESKPEYGSDLNDTASTKVIISSSSTQIKKTPGGVMIPDSYKAIELNLTRSCSAYAPATMAESVEALEKTATVLTVEGETDQYMDRQLQRYRACLDGKEIANAATYKQAYVTLTVGCGLSIADTENILREADVSFKANRLFKEAQVSMPSAPAAPTGYDPEIGIPVEYPQEEFLQGITNGTTQERNVGPGSGLAEHNMSSAEVGSSGGMSIEERTTQLAQQAAETGQQQVFDHASIGGLSVLSDISSVIDTAIPDFMKSLDRLGRILFLFYWNNSEFSERYGTQDIAGLEDSLKGVYKNFGNLVLQLKEKVIDASERSS